MATELWTYRDQSVAGLDLTGFEVETPEGSLGRVDRATEDIGGSYLVINPGPAMPLGRRVVVPAGVVESVHRDRRRIRVRARRDEILSAPEFDPERPLNELLRERIGTHFAPRGREQQQRQPRRQQRQRRSQAQRPRQQRQRRQRASSTRATARSRASTSRSRSRSTRSNEPTKEQLYNQAKRLGIEGRSKMNKAQLKRAVQRRK
jgi:hypothetical protein